LQHVPGHNIYELHVPIVAADVLITASGTLDQQARRLLQEGDAQPVSHATQSTGEISATAPASAEASGDKAENSSAISLCATLAVLALIAQ
jgi:archaellin